MHVSFCRVCGMYIYIYVYTVYILIYIIRICARDESLIKKQQVVEKQVSKKEEEESYRIRNLERSLTFAEQAKVRSTYIHA